MLEITSNGSKWAGESPDPIEALIERLETETLDPSFEEYGNFIHYAPILLNGITLSGVTRFWGNFETVSAVFSIDTDDPAIIAILTRAIRANQETEAYKAAKRAREAERQRAIEAAARRRAEDQHWRRRAHYADR